MKRWHVYGSALLLAIVLCAVAWVIWHDAAFWARVRSIQPPAEVVTPLPSPPIESALAPEVYVVLGRPLRQGWDRFNGTEALIWIEADEWITKLDAETLSRLTGTASGLTRFRVHEEGRGWAHPIPPVAIGKQHVFLLKRAPKYLSLGPNASVTNPNAQLIGAYPATPEILAKVRPGNE